MQSAKLPRSAVALDPWNGSGTATYTATPLGLNFIGIDLKPVMSGPTGGPPRVFAAPGVGVSLSHPATAARLERVKAEYVERAPAASHKLIRLRVLSSLDLLLDTWRSVVIFALNAAKTAGLAPQIDRTPVRPQVDIPAILGD